MMNDNNKMWDILKLNAYNFQFIVQITLTKYQN